MRRVCRFHGGAQPDLADISVFGVIRSVTCTDTFMDLMHQSRISAWYERMMAAVGPSSRLSSS
jgi:microsomal prostaglandin-E synthase 2